MPDTARSVTYILLSIINVTKLAQVYSVNLSPTPAVVHKLKPFIAYDDVTSSFNRLSKRNKSW